MNRKMKITVAISGLNNTDNPGPGVPVIRGIRESDVFDARIIGLAYENLEPGIYMKNLADKTYILPYPSVGADAYFERLAYIQSVEHIDVIIPNFDAELYSMIRLVPKLEQLGIKTFLPTLKQFEERQKSNLPEFGKKYGINVPESKPLTSENELYNLQGFSFPLVVKGKFYDAYIAANMAQAVQYFHKIASKWGVPVVVQEFIKGTEVNVIALGDGKGNTIAAVPMKKQFITDKGKAWAGITVSDTKMLDLTYKIISQTQWRGGMELELIRDDKGELQLIEINPRIPAWVYLAVGAGQNIPEALVRLALGENPEPFKSYESGKMFIRYSWDMICDLSDFEKLVINSEL